MHHLIFSCAVHVNLSKEIYNSQVNAIVNILESVDLEETRIRWCQITHNSLQSNSWVSNPRSHLLGTFEERGCTAEGEQQVSKQSFPCITT